MKSIKNIQRTLILTIILIFALGTISSSAQSDESYKDIVEKYNIMYDVNIGYVEVEGNPDIGEYEEFVKSVAQGEAETRAFIAKRITESEKASLFESKLDVPSMLMRASSTDVTKTNTALSCSAVTADICEVTCTYTTDGVTASNPRNVSASVDNTFFTMYNYTMNSWSYQYLDSNRTIGITTTGSLFVSSSLSTPYTLSNVTIYAEFYR